MDRLDISAGPTTVSDAVGDATSVLLTGPTRDHRVTTAGVSFLSSPEPAANHVHWVTTLRSPEDAVRTWTDQVATAPASLTVVGVGERRSAAEPRNAGRSDEPAYSTTHVESPSALTTLGLRLTDGLTSSTAAGRHRLWFESLSTLLQFVPSADAFRFLHALSARLTGAGAAGWFHLDPALHDPRLLHTFLSVCDARVSVDVDAEELVVRRR